MQDKKTVQKYNRVLWVLKSSAKEKAVQNTTRCLINPTMNPYEKQKTGPKYHSLHGHTVIPDYSCTEELYNLPFIHPTETSHQQSTPT